MILVALAGCPSGDGHPHRPVEPCEARGDPCAADLAVATWTPLAPGEQWAGYVLAVDPDGEHVLVGVPLDDTPSVAIVDARSLQLQGGWEDDRTSSFGTSLAAHDFPEGVRTAVGATTGGIGAVYVVDGLPAGEFEHGPTAAVLTIGGGYHASRMGQDCAFASVDGSDTVELLVGENSGNAITPTNGAIFAFDPDLRGEVGSDVATRRIEGDLEFGFRLTTWDGDGDGIDDLVAEATEAVARFQSPWVEDRDLADAETVWAAGGPEDDLGHALVNLGDIDADGAPDLAMGAHTRTLGDLERAGTLYVAQGGDLASRAAEDLLFRIVGTAIGEATGRSAAGADVDGDGFPDMVVGASGVPPAIDDPGKVLVYFGPLEPAVRTADDAGSVVYGEYAGDMFGGALAVVEADEDGLADLVVGAQSFEQGRGKVYLLPGVALVP